MPRANRHYVPGYIWHITHRCHKKEFLLKFAHDRNRFVFWLGEARKRYRLQILNYVVTSNHVHLLVRDQGATNCIPSAMQLLAGRTGQEYNQRKERKGAFWEDRYHATAIESGEHLLRCLVYIDLNMVRAGAVSHPEEWRHGGYLEIQGQRRRNRLLDLDALASSAGIGSLPALVDIHNEWVQEALRTNDLGRNEAWSKSLAVGSESFVLGTQDLLGAGGKSRNIVGQGDLFVLCEPEESYGADFSLKN
ncbi:transposase [Geoalkalibacter halelectricus]|uniref:Transposase n=1 Tax=Geoalkalibacter halelectricus TaxID=2847045 RepID=A0ABY5ZKN9_9BACT|nr:transposase [Geoalkalibacter halelectricus]MDO3378328.1 transposase [Geoalkalibacter halelectricus]UWZ79737.1 transposase [Geoalkalibacter halelectricus]